MVYIYFSTKDELTLTYINHPKSSLCLGFTFAVNYFMDLDKHNDIYQYSITQSIFAALKILFAQPIHLFPPTPAPYLYGFAFSRVSYS